MNNTEFVNKLLDVRKYQTKYAKGTFGQKATTSFINQKKKQYPKWYTDKKVAELMALPTDTRLFDCVGLIKGVMWGFPDIIYTSNGIKDYSDQTIYDVSKDKSTDFSNIQKGELLWLKGHVGVYIGDGKGIECTSAWSGNVQITAVANIGNIAGLKSRKWTAHAKLPFISYDSVEPTPEPTPAPIQLVYYVKKGDTLSSIAKAHNLTLAKLVSYNPQIKDINKINVGDKIYLSSQTKEEYYTVQKGDTLGFIARKFNMSLNKLLGLNPDIKNPNLIHVGDKIRVK